MAKLPSNQNSSKVANPKPIVSEETELNNSQYNMKSSPPVMKYWMNRVQLIVPLQSLVPHVVQVDYHYNFLVTCDGDFSQANWLQSW